VWLVTVLVGIWLGVSGCADDSEVADQDEDQRLNQFFEEVYERRVDESPIEQSRLGRKTDRLGEWDDVSDAFYERQIDQTRSDLERLRTEFDFEALSDDSRLSYELFEIDAERRIENASFRRHFYVVDQFNGQLSGLITVLQNNHDIETVQDAEDYISRIAGLEGVLLEFSTVLDSAAGPSRVRCSRASVFVSGGSDRCPQYQFGCADRRVRDQEYYFCRFS
jgi:uncharacterized protein (DUF885 family)